MQGLVVSPQTLLASAARTTSSTSSAFKIKGSNSIRVYVDVTAKTGTNPTLDIDIETSPDNSNWYTAVTMTQITDTGQFTDTATIIGPYVRVKYAFGGSDTPGFTFSVKMSKYNWAK